MGHSPRDGQPHFMTIPPYTSVLAWQQPPSQCRSQPLQRRHRRPLPPLLPHHTQPILPLIPHPIIPHNTADTDPTRARVPQATIQPHMLHPPPHNQQPPQRTTPTLSTPRQGIANTTLGGTQAPARRLLNRPPRRACQATSRATSPLGRANSLSARWPTPCPGRRHRLIRLRRGTPRLEDTLRPRYRRICGLLGRRRHPGRPRLRLPLPRMVRTTEVRRLRDEWVSLRE